MWGTGSNPAQTTFTVITLAQEPLTTAIEACKPYTYPTALVENTSRVIVSLQGLVAAGRLAIEHTELTTLALTPQEQWAQLGLKADQPTGTVSVPNASAPEFEAWQARVDQQAKLADASAAATLVTIIVAPAHVPLTGKRDLDAYIAISCGWSNTHTAKTADMIRKQFSLRSSSAALVVLT